MHFKGLYDWSASIIVRKYHYTYYDGIVFSGMMIMFNIWKDREVFLSQPNIEP
jgi:hypothetical protein